MPFDTPRGSSYTKVYNIEVENWQNPDGSKILEYLEEQGFEEGTDYSLGRPVNDKFDDKDTPIVRYEEEGFGRKVRSGTDKVLEAFGLEPKKFEAFKQSDEG